jgi:hypothetical protein
VLPAQGEESFDQSHGSGLSGTRFRTNLRTSSLEALGFRGALNYFVLAGCDFRKCKH